MRARYGKRGRQSTVEPNWAEARVFSIGEHGEHRERKKKSSVFSALSCSKNRFVDFQWVAAV
jgi:hypothetical protein